MGNALLLIKNRSKESSRNDYLANCKEAAIWSFFNLLTVSNFDKLKNLIQTKTHLFFFQFRFTRMKTIVLFLLITLLIIVKTANGATINVLINVQKSNFTNGPENFGINQVKSLFQYNLF